jgi:hypothetical protein
VKVVVTLPWRPTPDREAGFRFVWDWYVKIARLQGWDRICAVDSGHHEFNRAASRNACVRAASDADVVIINDADTIPHPSSLYEAVRDCADGRLHYGLDKMIYLDPEATKAYMAGEPVDVSSAREHDSSVYVIAPHRWWEAGGMDERFSGYGGEDGAFCSAARSLIGVQWHKGTAVSLYHDPMVRDIGSERWKPNSALAKRYYDASRSPSLIRKLIAEREYAR